MIATAAGILVALTGVYLVALGVAAWLRPARVSRFLAAFASSPAIHYLEQALRITAGVALVLAAPQMRHALLVAAFGWVLVVTSLALLAVPWRWHRRFARWAVPLALRHLRLFAVAGLMLGLLLLTALLLGPRAAA
jgi:uncharacterized protein YjeT (DUF2065 family)